MRQSLATLCETVAAAILLILLVVSALALLGIFPSAWW